MSHERGCRGRGDGGSALLLLPACALIVVLLAALSADAAVVHLGRRQLLQAAAGAANDAATYGLDEARLRRGEGLVLSPDRARAAVEASLAAGDLAGALAAAPIVEVGDGDGTQVTVELTMDVERLFAPGVPGADRTTRVTARASASTRSR